MAEKILVTRILQKIDSLENWNKSTLPLKKGEIAFATVAASAGTGLAEPVVMMKVGTEEEKTFAELPWAFYAKASDVLAACKTEQGLKDFINGVIADAGIASNDAMEALAGRVTTAEGKVTTLEGKMTSVEGKATDNAAAITALQGLVGDTEVATQIQNAITALNLGTTYEAKGEAAKVQTALDTYKTSNDKAVADNKAAIEAEVARADAAEKANANAINAIKDGTTIDSFADVEAALSGKEASGAAAQALVDAKAYVDGLAGNYDSKGAAATAESNAKTYAKEYADGLAGNYDASGSAAQALADAKKYTDDEIAEWVGDKTVGVQISTAIENLKLADNYAAKVHNHTKADITDFAHAHEISEVTGLQDALDDKDAAGAAASALAEAKTYADGKDAAITAAQDAADAAQADVDALETYVGTIPEGYTETNVIAYINKKAQETLDTASGGSSESAASVLAALNTYKAENDPKVTANTSAIAELEGLVGDTKVSTAIADAVAAEKTRAEGVEGGLNTRLAAVEGDYLKAADKTELEGKITTNANAIERLTNGVSAEEVDGVNDLIQYVKDHGAEVTGMKTDIKANADAIDAIEKDYLKAADKTELAGDITGLEGRMDTAEANIATKAAAADLTALAGRMTTAEGEIDTLQSEMDAVEGRALALEQKVGDATVSAQITAAIAGENLSQYAKNADLDAAKGRIDDLEADTHTHANKTELDKFVDGDKAKLDEAVQTVTAGTGLNATKTGTDVAIAFDDTVTFIFDCGDSTTV